MKKFKIFILFTILIVLTGCVKYDLRMNINTDKSFTLTIIDAIQSEYYDSDNIDSNTDEYTKLGYEVEKYKDDKYTGLSLSKKYDNIDLISSPNCPTIELTSLLDTNTSEIVLFKSQKTGTLTTYTADFTYDLSIDSSEDGEDIDYSSYSASMYFGYTITLPKNSKIISNNADIATNDGYTLTWEMEYGKIKDIDFVFTIDDKDVTLIPEENQQTINEIDKTSENEKKEEEKDNLESNSMVGQEENTTGSIISTLFVIVVILGLIFLKLKISSKSSSKKGNNNLSTFQHTEPRNNKKE